MAGRFSEFLAGLFAGTDDRPDVRRLAHEVEVRALQAAGQKPVAVSSHSPRESLRTASAALDAVILQQQARADAPEGEERANPPGVRQPSGTPKEPGPTDAGSGESPSGAVQLIELRDQLLLAARSEHATVPELSRHLYARLGEVLLVQGVEVLEGDGPLDPTRHEVVQVRDTGEKALDGFVAETLRPGYRFDHHLLRAQQVVTWRAAVPPLVTAPGPTPSDSR